jgi:hypothetical protein
MTRPIVGIYQRFGTTYCLHLQGWSNIDLQPNFYSPKMEEISSSKMAVLNIGLPVDTVARTVNLAKL